MRCDLPSFLSLFQAFFSTYPCAVSRGLGERGNTVRVNEYTDSSLGQLQREKYWAFPF